MPKNTVAVVAHVGPRSAGESMSAPWALAALAALGQPTRLDIFRLLMRREPEGLRGELPAPVVRASGRTRRSRRPRGNR